MKRAWKVKKRRFVRDKKGRVVGQPGDVLPYDDVNALACPSAVVAVVIEEDPELPTAGIGLTDAELDRATLREAGWPDSPDGNDAGEPDVRLED